MRLARSSDLRYELLRNGLEEKDMKRTLLIALVLFTAISLSGCYNNRSGPRGAWVSNSLPENQPAKLMRF
jgi:hypothetical protein